MNATMPYINVPAIIQAEQTVSRAASLPEVAKETNLNLVQLWRILDQVTSVQARANMHVEAESGEARFARHAARWQKETAHQSSLGKIFMHPSYQAIIGMGRDGLPFVLSALRDSNDPWFYALKLMAGKNVAEGIRDFETAKAAWLEWGYNQGHI